MTALETKQALLHPERVCEITQYILNNFKQKTHRLNATGKGFNAMFAVSSVEAAKLYYESFKALQQGVKIHLKLPPFSLLLRMRHKMQWAILRRKVLNQAQ